MYLNIKFEVKVDIENKKVDIYSLNLTSKMKKNIHDLYESLSKVEYFGRNDLHNINSIEHKD
jgi:hypothetical protein